MRVGLILPALSLLPFPAMAEGIQPGLYAIKYRMEMPHLERYAITLRVERCTDGEQIPVISAKETFAACAVEDRVGEASALSYSLVCEGAATARAFAKYKLSSNGFKGRVFVKFGAKNMTLTEVQSGVRLGACPHSEKRLSD